VTSRPDDLRFRAARFENDPWSAPLRSGAAVTIELLSLDRSEVVLVNDRVLAYRGRFRWRATEGSALIVPYSGHEDDLVAGARLSVETGQRSVSGLEIVSRWRRLGLRELATPGDFALIGRVQLVEDCDVFYVDVDDLSFAVDLEESGGVAPRARDRVSLVLHGLSLWCTNIW
jgi:hypothetical protein